MASNLWELKYSYEGQHELRTSYHVSKQGAEEARKKMEREYGPGNYYRKPVKIVPPENK